jgi:hypothetical protein
LCVAVASIAQRSNDKGIVAVNQAYVRLITKYFDWRSAVPKAHRNRIGETGHTCIFHVFERAYHQLRVIELTVTSQPLLFLPPEPPPPPPPPPQAPQLAAIGLGILDEE